MFGGTRFSLLFACGTLIGNRYETPMRSPKSSFLRWVIPAAALLGPGVAFAQITHICDVINLVNTAATWFGIVVFIVGMVAVLYAAFLYMTAVGDEESS